MKGQADGRLLKWTCNIKCCLLFSESWRNSCHPIPVGAAKIPFCFHPYLTLPHFVPLLLHAMFTTQAAPVNFSFFKIQDFKKCLLLISQLSYKTAGTYMFLLTQFMVFGGLRTVSSRAYHQQGVWLTLAMPQRQQSKQGSVGPWVGHVFNNWSLRR